MAATTAPWNPANSLAIEEEDVGLHFLRVEDAGGQAQERVHVRLLEQFAPDGLSLPATCQMAPHC